MSSKIFGRNFDDDIVEEKARNEAARRDADYPPERVTRMLEEASRKAYEDGYAKGKSEGFQDSEGRISAEAVLVTSSITPLLEKLLSEQKAHKAAIETDLTSFVISVIEKAVPQIISGYNDDRVEAEVRSICRRAQGSRWLEVRTSERMREPVESLIRKALSGNDDGKDLKVIADPTLSDAEIKAFWNGGASSQSHDRLCRRIIETLRADIAAKKSDDKETE